MSDPFPADVDPRHDNRPVLLACGPMPAPVTVRAVLDVTPSTADPQAAADAVAAAGLTVGDLHCGFVFAADAPVELAAVAYAAVCGFVGRVVDVVRPDGSAIVDSSGATLSAVAVDRQLRSTPMPARPRRPERVIQVGADHPELRSVAGSGPIGVADFETIRWASVCRWDPGSASVEVALMQLVMIAALRRRGTQDRLPLLVDGAEPADSATGLDLDVAYTLGSELRRRSHTDDRTACVPRVEQTARQRRLCAADEVELGGVLLRLGARRNERSALWHCPRPDRHTNGDAEASMRLARGMVQCYRCDPDRRGALALTMDVTGWDGDTAADWLLDPRAPALPACQPHAEAADQPFEPRRAP